MPAFLRHALLHGEADILDIARGFVIWCIAACAACIPFNSSAQSPYEVWANTTVYFSDPLNPLVLEDKQGDATLEQVRQRIAEFKPLDTITQIDPNAHYWVVQRLVNRLGESRELIVDASRTDRGTHWLRYQHYVVYPDGTSKELNGPFSQNVPLIMGDIDPFVFTLDTSLSRSPVFTLHRDSEVQLFSRLKSNSTYPAVSFSLRLYDRTTYLELRKFSLYLEGIFAGLMLTLILSTVYNLIYKHDTLAVTVALWLLTGWLQIIMLPMPDGQRLFEFFPSLHQDSVGILPSHVFWWALASLLQSILFCRFGQTFLGTRQHFPRLHWLTNFFIGLELLRFVVSSLIEHQIPSKIYWLPSMVLGLTVMMGYPIASMLRYRQGLRAGKFAAINSAVYACFYLIPLVNWFEIPVFEHLPTTIFGLLGRDSFVLQAIGICLAGIITNLSLQSRSRGIEKKLRVTLEAQKTAAQEQNKILESTVQERTLELQRQHKALNEAHELVTDSVNYASRLQRGQLPKAIRLENRFSSFATFWEPRDTIGGDLWWISSSRHMDVFVLAVADCTGHGVPGAMLSLLVSNSLERIYAHNTDEDPASALVSLDHFVRTGLNQDSPDSQSDDGCDAAILRIHKTQRVIEFAGAKIGLLQLDAQGQVTRHIGSRCSLGYVQRIPLSDKPRLTTLTYSPGDLFAIVTDGLTDQIGRHGEKKSSYGYRRLQTVLQKHVGCSAADMLERIKDDFMLWQGDEVRRDDVTVVVFAL